MKTVTWLRFEHDPNLADSFFAVGRADDGRHVIAWGADAGADEVSADDVEDGACGHEWYDSEAEAVEYMESIIETATSC